jgi:hypothetical protein
MLGSFEEFSVVEAGERDVGIVGDFGGDRFGDFAP